MMKTITLALLIASSLTPSFGQDTQHCYQLNAYRVGTVVHWMSEVCEFSSGRANIITTFQDDYTSTWYTPAQWIAYQPELMRRKEADAKLLEWVDAHTYRAHPPVVSTPVVTQTPITTQPSLPTFAASNKKDCKKVHGTWHGNTCVMP